MVLKFLSLICFIFFIQPTLGQTKPTPAPLADNSMAFCRKQVWAKACLNTLLTYRCGQYFSPLYPIKAARCSLAAQSMIDFMDYKTVEVHKDHYVYRFKIIFTNLLTDLINQPRVVKYLTSLSRDLKDAMKFHHPFDLYNYTLKFTRSRNEALTWLAVLFQDTSFSRVQVQYLEDLESHGDLNILEIQVKDLLYEIAVMLEPMNLERENYRSWLKLYPTIKGPDLNLILNPTFYHFYPIALMAVHLRSQFLTSDFSTLIPFILNSDYEFQSLDPDNWPWSHPSPFILTSKLQWKVRDIYTGLFASLFGSYKENLLPSMSSFEKQFAGDPFFTMRSWAYLGY